MMGMASTIILFIGITALALSLGYKIDCLEKKIDKLIKEK